MKPRIKVVTLGVTDLEKSLAFYRDGMGLPTQGIIGTEFEDGAVAFFDGVSQATETRRRNSHATHAKNHAMFVVR